MLVLALAVTRNRQNLDIDRLPFAGGRQVDRRNQFFHVLLLRNGRFATCLAIEIPEIDAFGQCLAALAFDIFPHLILDRFDHPRCLAPGHG